MAGELPKPPDAKTIAIYASWATDTRHRLISTVCEAASVGEVHLTFNRLPRLVYFGLIKSGHSTASKHLFMVIPESETRGRKRYSTVPEEIVLPDNDVADNEKIFRKIPQHLKDAFNVDRVKIKIHADITQPHLEPIAELLPSRGGYRLIIHGQEAGTKSSDN